MLQTKIEPEDVLTSLNIAGEILLKDDFLGCGFKMVYAQLNESPQKKIYHGLVRRFGWPLSGPCRSKFDITSKGSYFELTNLAFQYTPLNIVLRYVARRLRRNELVYHWVKTTSTVLQGSCSVKREKSAFKKFKKHYSTTNIDTPFVLIITDFNFMENIWYIKPFLWNLHPSVNSKKFKTSRFLFLDVVVIHNLLVTFFSQSFPVCYWCS